ncbi:translation initiation factor IF-2 [Rosettibacter firmus]|uniref:translation initiation factor IF-2 n=1 Tax=Rosettibacter firmus TaxID=3111522 RepID=UPI00336BC27B
MPDIVKEKKIRIYKFAAEYNLSTDTIIEFLQKKGYEVKSHMTLLTEEMENDIRAHFKKDIEKAEKHYKKISEFQKKRIEVEPEHPIETKPEEKIIEDKSVEKQEESKVEEKSVEVDKEEAKIVQVSEEIKQQTEETLVTETQQPVEEKNRDEEAETFRTETELELEAKKKGLTIVGKIDLEKKEKAEVTKQPEAVTQEVAEEEETKKKKKKKKKILKAKKKGKVGEEGVDEVVSKKKRKIKRLEIDKREVEEAIKRTMLSLDESALSERALIRKKKRKEKQEQQERLLEQKQLEQKKIKVTEFIAVGELANLMGVPVSEVIQKCINLGLMVSINQRLDVETITLIAADFGYEIELQDEYKADIDADIPDPEDKLKPRPPVVTIMGHVDHGKTSLLDFIRNTNVVAGEAGGITQHIGAYKVVLDNGKEITFLDTPGHEAFTAMRARGAKVTDIVVLVVAADDAVMPQTVEAINHAQAANVPIIVAINKIDKPNANVEKIKQQLAERNVLVEDWGGKYQCVEISAKLGKNVDLLLEKIILEAEMLELKANPDRLARGTIIEAQLDKGRGITATVLVQKGTLKIGDPFIAGIVYGRVRAMFDERGNKVMSAGPSTPVLVLGFEAAPQAGDIFIVVESEREAREISIKRQQLKREQDQRQVRLITLDEIANQISRGGVKELPIIVKGDVDGSVEALSDALMKLSNDEVNVRVIHKGVGAISEGDVLLAAASRAIIIGFHVRPNSNARKLAETEKVEIRLYNIIYDAINAVKSALEGMLSPVISEELVGTAEVRQIFKVPKVGTVAGCYVQDGKIIRNNKIRLIRDGIVIYEGQLESLKRFKDDVREVEKGFECGMSIANFNDIKVGDIIESYKIVETKKKLE